MRIYEITYDLRSPGRNYESLHQAIKSYGTWCHALESSWLVATTTGAQSVRDTLLPHIDANDGLLVTGLTGEAAWYGLPSAVSDWLHKQLALAGAA